MSAIFAFLAAYLWLIVLEVGGIRGTAMATIFSCLAVVTTGFALLLSHQTIISNLIVGAAVSAVWPPIILASIVLTDLYAADRNGHRALTTKLYMRYQRMKAKDSEHGKQFTA
jgi:hypothetical protein